MSVTDRISALTPVQRQLLEVLRQKSKPRPVSTAPPPIGRREPAEVWPVAIDQERLWFLFQIAPEDTSYNMDATTRLGGPLDPGLLQAAFSEVIRRHEVWRTSFPSVDGRPVLRIALPSLLEMPVVDLSGLPVPAREDEAHRVAGETVFSPFDLTAGPLVRTRLIRIAPEDHLLAFTVHHIVSDWVSFQIFWPELGAAYDAFSSGRPSPLPELPVQYADFAVWQRGWLQGETLDAHIEYWRKTLEDAPLMLDLPFDKPRPAYATNHGAKVPILLPRPVSDAIKALAQKERVTPFMAVLGLYQTMLHHVSRQERILVGSPNANRNRVELERLLGFFLTQIVFATDFSGDPTFRELLGRVRQTAIGAFAHQDLPFGKLVEALRPERDTSRPPVAQVQMVLLDAQNAGAMQLGPLTIQAVALEDTNAQMELSLSLWDTPEGIQGHLEYNSDLFEATTVERMAESFRRLAGGVIADPDRHVSDLPLWSDAARHQMLTEWNDTAVPPAEAGFGSAHEAFEAQARRTPRAVALVHGASRVTYDELNRRANQLAHHLIRLGIEPEARVGVCLERSPDLVAALLGVWKAGGAYVPLDPAYPRERLELMLEDSGAAVLVTRETLAAALRPTRAHILLLEAVSPDRSGEADRAPKAGPGNLAYAIYTSGSTGRPKAVGIEHRSVTAFLDWAASRFPAEAPAAFLAATSVCFDLSVFELFTPLTRGGRVVLAENALALPDLPAASEVTLVNTVPSALAELLRIGGLPPSVRTINLAGEPLPARLAADAYALKSVERVVNLYGPSEDTTYSTFAEVPRESDAPPIGRPIAGTRVYLLDRDLRPVPQGVSGELYLAGAGLARGYLGRPDLTAERFLPDAFGKPGGRVYRTGDRARTLPDGNLAFLGRADQQVKVRGFRVEPGEIETALALYPVVREAAVVAVAGLEGGKRLAAYIAADEDAGLVPALRVWLGERLPDYMVPALWTVLSALPHTPTGKVDRRALPAPEAPEADAAAFASPRTAAEEKLAGIWGSLLGARRIGVHDNFFQLGGDSILGIQVVARARQAGLAVTPKQIFQHQTVAELAAVAVPLDGAAPGESGPVEGEAPLTPIQSWFLDSDPPEPYHFNQAVLLAIRDVEPALLATALSTLLAHHDALRLRFARGAEGWRQWFSPVPSSGSPLSGVDLSVLPSEAVQAAMESAAADVQRSLDLGRGPAFRAAHFQLGESLEGRAAEEPSPPTPLPPALTPARERGAPTQESFSPPLPGDGSAGGRGGRGVRVSRLLLVAHHLVVDGVSWRILLEDLEAAYAQAAAGQAPVLPAKTTSWKRWAERLAEHARSETIAGELDLWLSLPETPPLPQDFPDGPDTEASSEGVSISISPEATRALLQDASEAYRTRINDLLLTALARAFARWTGSPRLLLHLEGHGREDLFPDIDLSRTAGWFTSLFPILLNAGGEGEAGLPDAIRGVKETLRAIPEAGLGYGLLRRMNAETAGRLARRPSPEVVFNYLGQLDQVLGAEGRFTAASEASGPVRSPLAPRRHRIEVNAAVVGGRLGASFGYSTGVHRRETVDCLANSFAAELESLITHCLRPEAGGLTTSDFPLARLDRELLDSLARSDGRSGRTIEDVYPLSPMQEGLLFHAIYSPGTETYFEQMNATFRGTLDAAAFRRAWQRLVDRHAVLRTSFLWEELDEPLQVVHRQVELPWLEEDWAVAPSPAHQRGGGTGRGLEGAAGEAPSPSLPASRERAPPPSRIGSVTFWKQTGNAASSWGGHRSPARPCCAPGSASTDSYGASTTF